MIRLSELTKTFGSIAAVRSVNLSIAAGEAFGLLGPNGAGKTTTIRMLTTLSLPTSGTATVAGHDILAEPLEVKRAIGVVPQMLNLDRALKISTSCLQRRQRWTGRPGISQRRRSAPFRCLHSWFLATLT